jgi:hypothetical protein
MDFTIGGHLVRYPWSAISDWAWYRNYRYRTERAESDIISDIGWSFIRYPISDIPLTTDSHSSLKLYPSLTKLRVAGSNLQGEMFFFIFNVGYRNELLCRYRNTFDIGMTFFSPTYLSPISEYQMSMSDVGYRLHWDRCRCPRMAFTCGEYSSAVSRTSLQAQLRSFDQWSLEIFRGAARALTNQRRKNRIFN